MEADTITQALFDEIKPPPFAKLREALEVALTNFGHALTFAAAVPGYGPACVREDDGPAVRARVLAELLAEALEMLRYDQEAEAAAGSPDAADAAASEDGGHA